jgi:Cu-Zn family superoxide dismutase
VHLHESGDCSAPDFKSAGDHFNPDAVAHGAPGSAVHHPGDFGNLTADAKGYGKLELTSKVLTLTPGKYCVIGKAVIVHDKPDDFGQPTGNAGGRVGCGVVQ